MRFKVFRTTRVTLLSTALVLAATLVASPAGTLAVSGPASSCADATPLKLLPREGSAIGAVTGAGVLAALASYKSQHDNLTAADRAAAAAGEAASAQKMARGRAPGLAANVAHFASRGEAVDACSGAMSTGATAQLGGRVAQAFARGAYACASNTSCDGSVLAYIQNLNHQNEGGGGTWCGPATVSMIALTEPGPSYVTQQTARDYINALQVAVDPSRTVEAVGSDDSSVLKALGKYVTGPNLGVTNWYLFISLGGSPTAQQRSDYNSRLVHDVLDDGYALAGNTWEHSGASNPHLPGHPTTGGDIFHYIEIGGYDLIDGLDYFADSATGVPGWGANVPAYSWYSEYNLVTLLGGRGYFW